VAMDGSKAFMIKANDTHVVVIATSLEKMWIAFGQGGNFQLIPVHELVTTIGLEKASELPFFYTFT